MNIALIGYGKMGKAIEQIATERGHSIRLIIDKDNASELTSENLKDIDAAIEFSTPNTAFDNYQACFKANVPVISGTTGWLDKMPQIKEQCRQGKAFFYASNFSLGVNIFFELNKKVTKLLAGFQQYDVDIEEIHHTQKLDSPSGTAITLAEGILENHPVKKQWHQGLTNDKTTLDIFAKRHGAVPGTHTIKWHSDVDEITIQHKAYGRQGFALGAVIAAEFMIKKQGFYEMKDLLEI